MLRNDDSPVLRSCAGGAPSVWRHTKRGDRYVAVVIDLTPVRYRAGAARLPDVVPVRSKKVLKNSLVQGARNGMSRLRRRLRGVIAGFKSTAGEEHPRGADSYGSLLRRVPGCQQAR